MKIKEIQCKTALGKCGFSKGALSINPYIGCQHGCVYCYARFMKKFTGHEEEWGTFVDVRTNIREVLKKQIESSEFKNNHIFIGTVTDPYQPIEKKYNITRNVLEVLVNHDNYVDILTKSSLILRDIDLLKRFKNIEVNITINTLDEKWRKLIEPNAPSIKDRLKVMEKLSCEGITVSALVGPFWPFFTDASGLFKEFKKAGVTHVFTESFNAIYANWIGVKKVLEKHYPDFLSKMKEIFFNDDKFYEFYNNTREQMNELSDKYNMPTSIRFHPKHGKD